MDDIVQNVRLEIERTKKAILKSEVENKIALLERLEKTELSYKIHVFPYLITHGYKDYIRMLNTTRVFDIIVDISKKIGITETKQSFECPIDSKEHYMCECCGFPMDSDSNGLELVCCFCGYSVITYDNTVDI